MKTTWFNKFICRLTVSQIHGIQSPIHQFGIRKWFRYHTKNRSNLNCHNFHCIWNNHRYWHHKMWHDRSNLQYKTPFVANVLAYHLDTWIGPSIVDNLCSHLHTMIIVDFLILFDEQACSYCNNHLRRFYSRTTVLKIKWNKWSYIIKNWII